MYSRFRLYGLRIYGLFSLFSLIWSYLLVNFSEIWSFLLLHIGHFGYMVHFWLVRTWTIYPESTVYVDSVSCTLDSGPFQRNRLRGNGNYSDIVVLRNLIIIAAIKLSRPSFNSSYCFFLICVIMPDHARMHDAACLHASGTVDS